MAISAFNFQQSDALVQESTKVVVVCERLRDGSAQQIVRSFSPFPALQPHVIELQASKGGRKAFGRVLRSVAFSAERPGSCRLVESQSAEEIWNKCWPGAVHERIIRYCMETGARLVIVPEKGKHNARGWWSTTLAEELSRYVPVLSLPNLASYQGMAWPQRRVRWLVPLDGSASAEAVLDPLRSVVRWLPSDVLLIQPLEYAQLWRRRVACRRPALIARTGVSIADSTEYLRWIAERHFAGTKVRVCCLSDSNSPASLIRLVNSPVIDAVAVGLSNRWRIMRWLSAEFNEQVFDKNPKPRLMLGTDAI